MREALYESVLTNWIGMSKEKETVPVTYELDIPQADVFDRNAGRLPSQLIEAAKTVVDYGSALIAASGSFRAEHIIRDAVLLALLRRATITVESISALLHRGLLEPAIALGRTLLDIELAIKLIHNDETDEFALRLAAYHYYAYQRHGQDVLSNRPTRTGILQRGDRISEVIEVSRSYANLLESEVFDSVREVVRRDTYWHGYKSAEAAFEAIGQPADYHMTYDSANWFVHAVNVDFDYDPSESTAEHVHLKALTHNSVTILKTFLGDTLFRYCEIISVYVSERGCPDTDAFRAASRILFPDGANEELESLDAIRAMLLETFREEDYAPGQDEPAG